MIPLSVIPFSGVHCMLNKWPKDLEMKIVDNHFVKNHKVDQKINGWSLRWNCSVTTLKYVYTVAFKVLNVFSPSLLFWPYIRHWIRVKKNRIQKIDFIQTGWNNASDVTATVDTVLNHPNKVCFADVADFLLQVKPPSVDGISNKLFYFYYKLFKNLLPFLRHRFDE